MVKPWKRDRKNRRDGKVTSMKTNYFPTTLSWAKNPLFLQESDRAESLPHHSHPFPVFCYIICEKLILEDINSEHMDLDVLVLWE